MNYATLGNDPIMAGQLLATFLKDEERQI